MRAMRKTVLFGLALAGAAIFSTSAMAQCDAFPKVPWWGKLNHDKVASYVSQKHEGNWEPYIKKWSKQIDKLKDVQERQSSVFVRYQGKKVKIAGNALANYIKLVEKRVNVVQCLAQQSKYANFATAAGGKKRKSKPKNRQ